MIPAQYLSPTAAQSILDTLAEGRGTSQGSSNTYSVLPSIAGGLMTPALISAILNVDLSAAASTISTAGLTQAEIDALNGIRSRVVEGLADAYASTPNQNPLNDHNTGLPFAQADQDHNVDVIIQTILFWDSRYFLRLRSDVGADAKNDVYELGGRYNYLSNPMIIATMRLHGFTSNVANIGPTSSRVTSSVPHGYYSGMSIQDMATASATTWTANLTQNTNTAGNIAAVDMFITSNATPTFSTGNDINVVVPSSTWLALNDLGSAHVAVTGNQIRFYRDAARTDQIRASWGNIASTGWQGTDTVNERVAVNTADQHLIIPTAPLQFNYTSGSNLPGIYETKYIADYNPTTQRFNSNVAGFSIYDGQLVNIIDQGTGTVFTNPANMIPPTYFKRVDSDTYQLFKTEDLAAGNVWAFGNTATISNIAYDAGNSVWQVNYDSTVAHPALLGGQDIRFVNTTGATDFSRARSITQNSAAGNIQITASTRVFNSSAVGTVSGRDRLVIGGSSGGLFYSDDGARWTAVSGGPTTNVRRIIWNTTLSRFEARTGAGDDRVWTSSNGTTWANTAPFAYSFTAPDEDTWVGCDTFDIYTLIQNSSTGELRIYTAAGTYPIGTGVTTTLLNGQNSRIAATTNVLAVKTPSALYRVARSGVGNASGWFTVNVAGNGITQTTSTLLTGLLSTGATFLVTDIGPGSRGQYTSGNYTFAAANTSVDVLGYLRGQYVFANSQQSGATEGYYKETISFGAMLNSYNDRYTATGHEFTTGQQIRTSATFNYNGTIVTPPQDLWVEVFDANNIDLFVNEERTIGYNSGQASGSMTGSTVTPVFYVKYRSARTWDLYLGSDVTNAANRFTDNTLMTGGTTTGSTVWNGYKTSITDDSATFVRPMFYPQYHSSTRVSLWANAAKTVPYAYFGRNGTGLNQQVAYTTSGTYSLNGIAHELVVGQDNVLPNIVIGINTTPMYWANVVNDYVIDLYADSALTTPYTQATWANSAATLWQVNPGYDGSYRIDTFYVPNIGTKTYFTTNLTTNTTSVNATWGLTENKFYTRFNQTQSVYTVPALLVNEHSAANAGAYYGQARYTYTSGSGGPGNVAVVSSDIYGGFGGAPSPVYYRLNDPGRFNQDAPIMMGIFAAPDTGTPPAVDAALAYTGNAWATGSNLTDRDLRVWPSTIAPATMTWTIEQPNSTLESYNLTRYSRARDVTQYRMRLTYPPMTKVQVAEFTNVIHAARGSHKPLVFTPPLNDQTQQYVTIKVGDKNETVPVRFRTRNTIASGEQVVRVDGLPPSLTLEDPAFDAGWAVELPIRNSTGSWGIPIHDVLTNAYGEANMRLNNNIASALPFGSAIGADAADLDVFIDADSVEIKVDTIGRHYLEIDLVTKRIF